MAEHLWIKVFLFLVLELHVTAVFAQVSSILKRAGDEVILPCENVIEGQQNCNGTTWLFEGSKSNELVALVAYGQIEGDTRTRLRVTPSCFLLIKNITADDVGLYECQQYYTYEHKKGPKIVIDLSVVTMTKHEENKTVTLSCSVTKSGSCKHKVKWLFKHQEVDKEKLKTSETDCSATVTYLESSSSNRSLADQFFQCEVTRYGHEKQLFSFRYSSSDLNNDLKFPEVMCLNSTTAAIHKPTTQDRNQMKITPGSTPYITVGIGLLIVVIIFVVVIRWRVKRKKTRKDENTVDVQEGVLYASISHPKSNSDDVLVHGDPNTVTYSTVKCSSSTAAASDTNNHCSLITVN